MNSQKQRFETVDSRTISLLLFQAGISRRSFARDLGLHHLIVVRTIANIKGVSPKKRIAVIQALSERLGLPIEEIFHSGLEVNRELGSLGRK